MISLNSLTDVVIEEASEKPVKTYKIDFEEGRIKGYADGMEAVKQYIKKTLITPRFDCLIYSGNYGSDIEKTMVANKWNRETAKLLLPELIKDALTDERILEVYDFEFDDVESREDILTVSFKADTVYGEIYINEGVSIIV